MQSKMKCCELSGSSRCTADCESNVNGKWHGITLLFYTISMNMIVGNTAFLMAYPLKILRYKQTAQKP
jgi:hypothetical protein